MKKTIIAATALVAMTACNKTLIETPMTDSNYGYINLGITADTEMVVTKGITANGVDDIDTYNVALLVKSGEVYVPFWTSEKFDGVTIKEGYIEYSDLSNSKFWTVPAGEYKIVVENKTESEALVDNGAVRVEGTETFKVNAGATQTVAVSCNPVNSKVTVSKTTAFDAAFTASSVSVTGAGRNFYLNWTAKPEVKSNTLYNEAYFNAATQIAWNLSVTLTDGTTKTYSKTNALSTVAGTWSNIDFNASTTNGSINVTITVNNEFGIVDVIEETINPGDSNN